MPKQAALNRHPEEAARQLAGRQALSRDARPSKGDDQQRGRSSFEARR
jgi:hypothetical protein